MGRREDKKRGNFLTSIGRQGKSTSESVNHSNQEIRQLYTEAVRLQQSGRLLDAEKAWEELRLEFPDHEGINVNLATVMWRQGRLEAAAAICHHAIMSNPLSAEGFALLGAVLASQKDNKGAVINLEKAVALKPGLVTAWVQLAILYKDNANLDLALDACERAEEIESGRADVLNVMGLVFQARGDWESAERSFRSAADIFPSGRLRAEIETNLAGLFIGQALFGKAAKCCRRAIDAYSYFPQAYNVLGVALKSMDDLTGAKVAFEQACLLNPEMAEAQINLGTVFGIWGEWENALKCYDQALQINPNSAEALNNQGNILSSMARYDEAVEKYKRAIGIDKNYAEPHINLAFELLAQGNWTEGWPEFEWRWQTLQMKPFFRSFAVPKWDGSYEPSATLLVHAEQGMGDTLNFARYLPLAAARVGRLVFECQASLIELYADMEGVDELIISNGPHPHFDLHIPLLSLPGLFFTTPGTVPGPFPYIRSHRRRKLSLPEFGAGLKVGIVWAGNSENPADVYRTIGLAPLKKLFEVSGCIFYSLQYGDIAEQIAAEGLETSIYNLSPLLKDFCATADLVVQLDLVISVCTSVAHLAGTLGVETWLLLSKEADWRWMRDRNDSPWYPSMRLFRQNKLHEWAELVDTVAEALEFRGAPESEN